MLAVSTKEGKNTQTRYRKRNNNEGGYSKTEEELGQEEVGSDNSLTYSDREYASDDCYDGDIADLGEAPAAPTKEDFDPHPPLMHRVSETPSTSPVGASTLTPPTPVFSTLHTLSGVARNDEPTPGDFGQYSYLYGRYPEVSAPPLSTESEISSSSSDMMMSDSDIASEAGRYIRRHRRREAHRVRSGATRSRSGRHKTSKATERAQPDLEEDELICAHCATPHPDRYKGYVTTYACCARKSHTVCVISNPTASALLHGEFDPAPPESVEDLVSANARTPCLSCLRPSQLLPRQDLLQGYHEYFNEQTLEDGSGSSPTVGGALPSTEAPNPTNGDVKTQATGIFNRIFRRNKETADGGWGSSSGNVSDSVSESATSIASDDTPVSGTHSIAAMIKNGRTLEDIAKEFRLYRIDDEYEETWDRLGFSKRVLLALPDTDLLFYMRNYEIHPYVLRHKFRIKLADLWVGDEQRETTIRTYMDANPSMGTLDSCATLEILSPIKLAIMGFDLHHMLQMGFTKADFSKFPAYSLSDWVQILGFCKPHWWLLKFEAEDLVSTGGSGRASTREALGRGWSVANLVNEWRLEITDLRNMELIDVENMLSQLEGPREVLELPDPSSTIKYRAQGMGPPSPHYRFHHRQSRYPMGEGRSQEMGYRARLPALSYYSRTVRGGGAGVARKYGV